MTTNQKNVPCCPLCSNKSNQLVELLHSEELIKLWSDQKDMDISNILSGVSQISCYRCSNCSLGYFDPQTPGDDEFYGQLADDDLYYLHEGKSEFLFSKKLISPGSKVLDVGSGRGVFFNYLDLDIDYTGLELSSAAVKLARKDSINVLNSKIEDFAKNSDKKFDFVISFQVLEHIDNIKSFMDSAIKLMNNHGKIILAVPNNQSFIQKTPNHILNLPPHHILHWSKESLEFLASKFNLKVVEIFCERVSKAHLRSFYFSKIDHFIKRMFLIPFHQVNTSLTRTIISKIAWKFSNIIASTNINFAKNSLGQTIIIVLEK